MHRPSRPTLHAAPAALEEGSAGLAFDAHPGIGYPPALLDALDVPVESQLLVYSKTSLQARLIVLNIRAPSISTMPRPSVPTEREALIEILTATKPGLPEYFHAH